MEKNARLQSGEDKEKLTPTNDKGVTPPKTT